LKVVLTYDRVDAVDAADGLPEDFGAEYEDQRTIDALLEAIRANGHEASGLVVGEDFPVRIGQLQPDLVFNIAEGVRGPARESIVPAWLDQLGVAYTGSDGLTLAVSLDKAVSKTLAAACGVRTPAFRRIRSESELEALDLDYPLFVKPTGEGSSMGIRAESKVTDFEGLRRQVAWVLENYGGDCLVEQFAPGREFCVGLLGNERVELLPIVEIRCEGQFYHYGHKSRHDKQLICPADISPQMADSMRDMALKVYRALNCRDFARADFKLDAAGQPTFLEINPLPGLSPFYSIFTRQAEAAGLTYEQLIGRIIQLAVGRNAKRRERVPV